MAQERLSGRGPLDPAHGYPMWYEDQNSNRLSLGVGTDPLTPAMGDIPDPGSALAIPGNFPDEAFYFLAESRMTVGGAGVAGRARLVLALEAAFGGPGVPAADARVVFARIRVRMDDLIPGAGYVVAHPYGVTELLIADDDGRVFWTDDRGIADQDFDAVVNQGRVAPFLRWANGAPAGYLGDGVTERAVVGSPFGTNFFRVDGPAVGTQGAPRDPNDPGNPDRAQSALFTVQGRIARVLGAEITSAIYARGIDGAVVLDVHARSAPGQSLETAFPRAPMANRDRDYVTRVAAASRPTDVAVANISDVPITRTSAAVTDRVDIDAADHDPAAGTLTITARSSDLSTPPTLTPILRQQGLTAVTELAPLTGSTTTYSNIAATPAEVEVASSAGGRATRRVRLVGAATPAGGPEADAGPDSVVVTATTATLDGRGSRGEISAWAWTQTAGTPVTLTGDTTTQPTFTAPAPGTLGFRLDVQGPADADFDDVTVTVVPTPPPGVVTVTRCQFRTGRLQWRVDGQHNGPLPARVTVRFQGAEIGGGAVDLTGAWSVRRTLTAADAALRPTVGDVVGAATATSPEALAPINIRN